jgi:hypothetical protein
LLPLLNLPLLNLPLPLLPPPPAAGGGCWLPTGDDDERKARGAALGKSKNIELFCGIKMKPSLQKRNKIRQQKEFIRLKETIFTVICSSNPQPKPMPQGDEDGETAAKRLLGAAGGWIAAASLGEARQ